MFIQGPSAEAGVEFSDKTVNFILDLTGYQPLNLQVACFHAFDLQSRKGIIEEADYHRLREQVETDLLNLPERNLSGSGKQR